MNYAYWFERGTTAPVQYILCSSFHSRKKAQRRVSTTQRLMKAHDELIVKWSAMLPDVRAKMVTRYATDLGLFKSENLKRFGFELGPKWMELPCRVLNAVQVLGGDQKAVPPINSKVDLRNKTFHAPLALRKWAMINYGVDGQTFASFKDWFLEVIRQKGCQVDAPMEITISTELSAEALMKKAKDAGFLFVFIILADRLEIHDALKYYEQQYQVVTQITKSSVVRKAVERNQGVTLENILLKTCIKNAGIPYGVETMKGALKSNDALYIGLAYSHQQGTGGTSRRFKEVPSRVGYAATCSSHPNRVIGDFKFIEPHNNEAALNAIVEIVAQCVEAFTKNRKNIVPKTVVMYLTGYSEGQWAKLKADVVQKIKGVLGQTKLICILENKKTMERLYKLDRSGNRAQETNVQPGSCLDHTVMPPGCKGFYLHPHIVLQGTARSAKYTVLVNEPNVPLVDIEYVTHALCFLHSVCLTPTAEPAVLTIADRCANRGQTVLKYHMRQNKLDQFSVEDANKLLTNPLSGRLHAIRYNA